MANRFPFLTQISKHLQSISSRSSRVFFSTASHQHVQGDDAVARATNNPDNPVINLDVGDGDIKKDEDHNSGVTGFVAAAAKQGTMKATEVVENIADMAKETVDTAWDATKNTAQNIRDTTTAEADTNVVDTAEYRSSEDLKGQLGDGHDSRIKI